MKRQASVLIPTKWGNFTMIAYSDDPEDRMPHLAMVSEHFDATKPIPVRIHSECMTGDIWGSRRCDCGQQLDSAMSLAAMEGGVVIYLRQEGRGIGIINKIKAYNLQDDGLDTIGANLHLGFEADERSYEIALWIIKDLGISQVRLITNNPDKIEAFLGSGIEVVERIPTIAPPGSDNERYLRTKKERMGHLLDIR